MKGDIVNKELIINKNGLKYDFNAYKQYEDIGGYFGFIGPDGSFYRVRKLYDEPSMYPHNTWANEFIKFNNLSYDSYIGTTSTALVKKYGFILYTCYNEWDHCGQELFILPDCDGIHRADKCETLCHNISQLETIRNIVKNNLDNEPNYKKSR